MGFEVKYHPSRWVHTRAGVNGKMANVERQEVWMETGDNEWLHVVVQRLATGRSRPAYVAEAFIRRDLQPNGKWRSARHLEQTKIRLTADSDAPASVAPKPLTPPDSVTAHMKRTKYAVPGQDEPDEKQPTRYTVRAR